MLERTTPAWSQRTKQRQDVLWKGFSLTLLAWPGCRVCCCSPGKISGKEWCPPPHGAFASHAVSFEMFPVLRSFKRSRSVLLHWLINTERRAGCSSPPNCLQWEEQWEKQTPQQSKNSATQSPWQNPRGCKTNLCVALSCVNGRGKPRVCLP